MHCSIMARFFIISILLNTVFYCSQKKLREIPETRMVVWEPPVVDIIKAQVQKEKKPAQRKFRLSVPQHHFARAVRENDLLDRMMEKLDGEPRALHADSKQEVETRVVAWQPSQARAKGPRLKRQFSANGVEMQLSSANAKNDVESEPVVQRFQPGNTNVDTRYFVNMFARLQAMEERRDTPIVRGSVNLQQLINNHYSDENGELLLLAFNVCAEAQRQKLLRGIRAMFAEGDRALPLIRAAYYQSGLPINTKIDGHWTGLHIACARGHYDLAEFFVQHNANVNIRGPEKRTPLMCAVDSGRIDIVELLTKDTTIDPDRKDQDGETALIKAVNNGNWRAVSLIGLAGASMLVTDANGKTPFELAKIHLAKLKASPQKCTITEVDGSADKSADADSDDEDEVIQNKELIEAYEIMLPFLRIKENDQRKTLAETEAHNKLATDNGFEVIPNKTSLTRSSNNAAPFCDFPEERSETWKYWLVWHFKRLVEEVVG